MDVNTHAFFLPEFTEYMLYILMWCNKIFWFILVVVEIRLPEILTLSFVETLFTMPNDIYLALATWKRVAADHCAALKKLSVAMETHRRGNSVHRTKNASHRGALPWKRRPISITSDYTLSVGTGVVLFDTRGCGLQWRKVKRQILVDAVHLDMLELWMVLKEYELCLACTFGCRPQKR